MGEKMRKQKLVSICAVDHTPINDLKFFSTKAGNSASTHLHYITNIITLQTTVKAPINAHNLLMLEVYPESRDDRSDNLPCIKLNFLLLCYGPNTQVDDMRYNFDHEYKSVKYVDFSGPIGSMRLAFELLQKFPRCEEVTFILNDFNAKVPYEKDEDLNSLYQNWKVEVVRIVHDMSIEEKETKDLQSKTWRLDEILAGCQACFPNLRKFEVSIHGTGVNFDKVCNFVAGHKILRGNYLVEIINEKVRCKPKPPPTQKTLNPTGTKPVNSLEIAKIPPLPVDLSIIKLEPEHVTDAAEQFPVPVPSFSPSLYAQAPVNDHTSGIQYPVNAGIQKRDRVNSNNEGITPPPTPPAFPNGPYVNTNCSIKDPRGPRALCWGNERGSDSCPQPEHPLNQLAPPEMPSSSASYLSSKEVKDKVQMQRLQPTTSKSAYDVEIGDGDDEDLADRKIRMNRNPSPPVVISNPFPPIVENMSAIERPGSSYSNDMSVDDVQGRRVPPKPPVISSEPRDPRRRAPEGSRSVSPSGSRRNRRSRSRSYSRYSSRSRSPSPSLRKRPYRPRSRSRDFERYSDRSGDFRRYRHRSYSRSPSPNPSHYSGGETSRRGGYDGSRDRGCYSRGSKSPYYVNGYTRRPRGRGSRGFRSRGRGRGRGRGHPGNRGGFKPSGYDNGDYFADPRHRQDDEERWDDGGNDE